MPLPSSGPISASQIRTELEVPSQVPFSLYSAEMVTYTDLNTLSISSSGTKPNIDTPNSMSEWYNYNHHFRVSCSANNLISLRAPSGSTYTTFGEFNMGTTSGIVTLSGSLFTLSGTAPSASVSYSVFYQTYSLNIRNNNNKRLSRGVLNSTTPTASFNYIYNSSSGSNITVLFTDSVPPKITGSAYSNVGSASAGDVTLGGSSFRPNYTIPAGTSLVLTGSDTFTSTGIGLNAALGVARSLPMNISGDATSLLFTGKIYKHATFSSVTWNWYDANNNWTSSTITDNSQIQLTNIRSLPSITVYVSQSITYGSYRAFWVPSGSSLFTTSYYHFDEIIAPA